MDHLDDIVDVFHMLAMGGGGSVGTDEFTDGIKKIVSSDRPLEILWIQKYLHSITDRLIALQELTRPGSRSSRWCSS